MFRTLIGAAALVILVAGAAKAQYNSSSGGNNSGGNINMNMMPDSRRHLTPEEAQREREIESRYNETINDKIPDKKVSNDPWGNMRSTPAASTAGKQRK
jgi:hypothetical protein